MIIKQYTFLQGSWDTWKWNAYRQNCKSTIWKSTEIFNKDPLFIWNLVHFVDNLWHRPQQWKSKERGWQQKDLRNRWCEPRFTLCGSLNTLACGTILCSKRILFKASFKQKYNPKTKIQANHHRYLHTSFSSMLVLGSGHLK